LAATRPLGPAPTIATRAPDRSRTQRRYPIGRRWPIDAATALDWASSPRRASRGAGRRARHIIVDAIARSSPLTVGIRKEAFYAQIELDEHRSYDLTKTVLAMNARADERPGRHERLPVVRSLG
jgi:hypothetical protein